MKKSFKTRISRVLTVFIVLILLIGISMSGCVQPADNEINQPDSSGPIDNNNQTPDASDFNIVGLQAAYDGTPKSVTITPKYGKSQGARTIYYEGINNIYTKSTKAPLSVGTYSVTFDISASANWNTANGLPAGTLIIKKADGAEVDVPTAELIDLYCITLHAAAVPDNGQIIEYAKSENTDEPSFDWQTDTTFNGLTAGTTYYFFARARENDNYKTGAANSAPIATKEYRGNTVITYWADDIGGICIETSGEHIVNNTVAVNYGDSVAFTAIGEGYTDQSWTLNGVAAGNSAKFTFYTVSREFGNYTIGLRVQKNGKYYFTEITVMVR